MEHQKCLQGKTDEAAGGRRRALPHPSLLPEVSFAAFQRVFTVPDQART